MSPRLVVVAASTALLVALATTTCVPATDPRDPKGAAGVTTAPSPATRGEPFVTDDGWTVRIGALYLRALVTAESLKTTADTNAEGYASLTEYMFDARTPEEMWTPAIFEGPARVGLQLTPGYVLPEQTASFPDDGTEVAGVPDDVRRRFYRAEEALSPFGDASSVAPALVFVATGEKDGARVVVDIAVSSSSDTGRPTAVDVVRDELRTVPFALSAEELFAFTGDGQKRFQPIADADRDHDGRVTAAELSAVTACSLVDGGAPKPSAPGDARCLRTVVDLLRLRAPAVIGAPPLDIGTIVP